MILTKSQTTKVGYVADLPYDMEDFIYAADTSVKLTDSHYTFISDLQDRYHVHGQHMIITETQAKMIDGIREKIGFIE